MTDKQLQTLRELGATNFGRVLREYLDEELLQLRNVENASSWEDTLARQKAVTVIKKLFSFLEERKVDIKSHNQYV